MLRIRPIIALTLLLSISSFAQTLPLLPRTTNAISTADFIRQIKPLPLTDREQAIASEILHGNVPSRLRDLHPLDITNVSYGKTNVATIFVTRDYLSIGTDAEFFRTPLTPATAQRIADELDCTLPTRKMVDAIYAAAQIKLVPQPIPPNAAMTTVPVFATHNEIIRTQLLALGASPTSTALIAGHKKDVVISAKLAALTNNVAIYGWHRTNGTAIQPLHTGHRADWADYSHGIRLVQQRMILNGDTTTVARVLADPELSVLLSDEGVITNSRYGTSDSRLLNAPRPVPLCEPTPRPSQEGNIFPNAPHHAPLLGGAGGGSAHRKEWDFAERITTLSPAPEVTIEINSPPAKDFAPDKPVLLILYALPNGNTTAQTVGKKLLPGDDWHFDIQHIGAQPSPIAPSSSRISKPK